VLIASAGHLQRTDRSRRDERGLCLVIAVFVYRDMTLKDVPRVLLGSAT